MKQYQEALRYIMMTGNDVSDRTGVGTRSVFGYTMRFDLEEGFPAVTTKKLAWKSVVSELLWFLEGSTDERRLVEILYGKPRSELKDKTTIWTANADKQGVELGYINNLERKELGPVYGHQWRNFNGGHDSDIKYPSYDIFGPRTDQIAVIVKQIKETPDNRRILMSAWNPQQISEMALPPCHVLTQFRVVKGKLSCLMYQRSCDMFLGIPFNIASYALLTHMIANHCDLGVGELIMNLGDAHIYNNHFDQVDELLSREPCGLPTLVMPKIESFDIDYVKTLKVADFVLENYNPLPTIKAPMAV